MSVRSHSLGLLLPVVSPFPSCDNYSKKVRSTTLSSNFHIFLANPPWIFLCCDPHRDTKIIAWSNEDNVSSLTGSLLYRWISVYSKCLALFCTPLDHFLPLEFSMECDLPGWMCLWDSHGERLRFLAAKSSRQQGQDVKAQPCCFFLRFLRGL